MMATRAQGTQIVWWWLVPLLLLSFALGAAGLNADPLWADEYHSVFDAGGSIFGPRSPQQIWEGLAARNPWHAPGYFVILAGWGALTGWQPPTLRALSVLFGLLALAWTYRLGRDHLSARAGVIAVGLLGTAALFTHYLHELRMYTLLLALMIFTVWLYLRMIRPAYTPTRLEWAGLLVGGVGLLYTHFFGALPLAAVGVYHLLFVRKDRRWWGIVGVLALTGVLFLPWADVLRAGIRETQQDTDLHAEALDTGGALLRLVELVSNDYMLPVVILAAVAALSAVLALRRGIFSLGTRRMWYFGLALLGLILAVNMALDLLSADRARYLLLPLPFLLLALSAAFSFDWRGWRRWLALAILLLWLASGTAASVNRAVTDEVDGSGYIFPLQRVTETLDEQLQGNDVVIHYLPSAGNPSSSYERMAAYYFAGLPAAYDFDQIATDAAGLASDIESGRAMIAGRQHFWLAHMPAYDPDAFSQIESVLDDTYQFCFAPIDDAELTLALYTRSPVCCPPAATAQPPLAAYGDGIGLALADVPAESVGGSLPLLLSWSLAADVPAETYSVALHIIDESGALVAQADYGLRALAFSCYDQAIDVAALPPGSYELRAGVYTWQTGERLPGTLTADGTQGDMLPIATFRIAQ
jgi:hypothetical protein